MARKRRSNRSLAVAMLPAALGLVVTLSACGAGQVSQTASQASAVNGYSGQVGSIAVRDASIAYAGQAKTGAIYRTGGAAQLDITLVNVGPNPDKLIRASSPDAAAVQIQGDGTIGGYQTVSIGNTDSPSDANSLAVRTLKVTLIGLKRDITAGTNYPVQLVFQRAGTLNARLPVGYPTGPLAIRDAAN
jgi:hypothetical protein